jgi:beta-lactam-binding protein with PASTA domain
MDFKKFWNESFLGFLLKRILLAIVIFVALSWITLALIDVYTNHGEAEIVPNLKGSYVEEAELLLAEKGLYPVVIDSVYVRERKLGTIIEQTPSPNSTMKRNRPVYLIINTRQVRQVPLPDIVDVSFRQADAMLKSLRINIASVEYKPSEYKDLVLDIKYRGLVVPAGTRIPEGASVVLVVGRGLGGDAVVVPNLRGLTLENARQEALASMLVIGAVEYDVQPSGNDSEYIVYRQRHAAGKELPSGSRIDVWLSKDKSLLNKVFKEDIVEEDESFF